MKLDAHQHYWDPKRGDYHWMPKENETLYRIYGPEHLAPHLARGGIDGTVAVQAAATVAETDYLLDLAYKNENIKGVVGWINFEDATQINTLKRLAKHPKFKGVRPMIQDIEDPDWMLRDEIGWAYRALMDLDLSFDALGAPLHLPNFLKLFTKYPSMRVVIDHCMKPAIRDAQKGKDAFTYWAGAMSDLAMKTSAYCKLSGLVTEADDGWTTDDLRPFTDHVLTEFGPDRVMWGSDWPVCSLQSEYDDWLNIATSLTAHLPREARRQIFGGTAARFYKIT